MKYQSNRKVEHQVTETESLAVAAKKENSRQIVVLKIGVADSNVTAYLLKEQGWNVSGITMKIPNSC